MKIFAIRSESAKKAENLAYLIYYESEKTFYIELPEDADEWETPLILSSYLKKGEKTVSPQHSKMWVQQRIVPADRQNLGQILKDNNMESYDEFELLKLSKGRCAQDDYYLYPISPDKLPADFNIRFGKRITNVVPLKNNYILVFFKNGETKKCDVSSFIKKANCSSVLSKPENFNSLEVLVGGYGVSWGTVLSIPNEKLYDTGEAINISSDDFKSFVSNRVIDIAKACDILGCSRQNICDLIKRGKLTPIDSENGNIMLMKNEVLERKWN